MKQRDLVKKLESIGFKLYRHGGNHDVYRRGSDEEQIPRHKEINERLAKAIEESAGRVSETPADLSEVSWKGIADKVLD